MTCYSTKNSGKRKRAWRQHCLDKYAECVGNSDGGNLPRPLQFISLVDGDDELCQLTNCGFVYPEQYVGVNWEKKAGEWEYDEGQKGMIDVLKRWHGKSGAEFHVGEIGQVIRRRLAQDDLDPGFINLDTCCGAENGAKLCALVMNDCDGLYPNGEIFIALNITVDYMWRRKNKTPIYGSTEISEMIGNEYHKINGGDVGENWTCEGEYAYRGDSGHTDMLTLFFVRRKTKFVPHWNKWYKQVYLNQMTPQQKAWRKMHRDHRQTGGKYNRGRKKVIA
jgi:hypothetical protein